MLKDNPNLKSLDEYKAKMKEQGVKVKETINKQGKIQGLRMEYKGKDFKASEVYYKATLQKDLKHLNTNQEKQPTKFQTKEMKVTQSNTISLPKKEQKYKKVGLAVGNVKGKAVGKVKGDIKGKLKEVTGYSKIKAEVTKGVTQITGIVTSNLPPTSVIGLAKKVISKVQVKGIEI